MSRELSLFIKASAFDLVLVLLLSVGLCATVSYGFYVDAALRGNLLLAAGVALPLLVVLYAGSWSRRARVPAAVGAVAICAVVLGVAAALMPEGVSFLNGNQLNDVPENYLVWALALLACTLLSFLLSRRTATLGVLAVLSVLACATVQFLYRDWLGTQHGLALGALVMFSCTALFVYQRYRLCALGHARMARPSFGGAFASACVIAGLCLGVGAALYFGVVAALGLTTPELKPFSDYYQRPVVEYSSPLDTQRIESPDVTSSTTTDNVRDTSQQALGGAAPQQSLQGQGQSSQATSSQLLSAFDEALQNQQYLSIGYDLLKRSLPVLVPLLLLALLAAVLARRGLREHRLKRIAGRSCAYQAVWIYEFLEGRFAKLGIKRPPEMTPLAFAFARMGEMAPYTQGAGGADFVALTLSYQRAAYGGQQPSEEELAQMRAYYRAFFGNARRQLGWRRWLFFRFWTI